MRTAREFAEEYCRRHNKGQHEKWITDYIVSREISIAKSINKLDQKTRDLMQLVSGTVKSDELLC